MVYRVLIVDDSVSVRTVLSSIIDSQPDLSVLASVGDPFEAARVISQEVPDVIILDIEMPKMDGLTFLRRIMAQKPIPVIICSSLVREGSSRFWDALRLGAIDVMEKPNLSSSQHREEASTRLPDKVRAAANARVKRRNREPSTATPIQPRPKQTADAVLPPPRRNGARATSKLIAIGASTGGTTALEDVLERLGGDVPPIAVVQHMPERFTRALANRLDRKLRLSVKEAETGDVLEPGRVLIAPGDRHLVVRARGKGYRVETIDGPLVSRHRPSVDVLFRSVAESAGPHALGVIMTGMGDDGAAGLEEMKKARSRTIAQDEASCVVFGMPAEAMKRGCVDLIANPIQIASEIVRFSC